MSTANKYFEKIRRNGYRLTNNRIKIIEILENQHLTFKELQQELNKKGLYNVSSIYNNLDFLIKENIVIELHIGNTTYYDLAKYNPGHNDASHIHVIDHKTNKIIDIRSEDIIKYVQNHKDFKDLDIDYIRIIAGTNYKK